MLSAGPKIRSNYRGFQLGADLPRADFLGGRFAEGRIGKGPICPAPFEGYDNTDLCVLQHPKQYLSLTEGLKGEETQLLISAVKPHKPVSIDTVSRWAKCMLQHSGVNIKTFTTHSTRAAATSKSYSIGLPLQDILSAASWSNAKTFCVWFNRITIKLHLQVSSFNPKLYMSVVWKYQACINVEKIFLSYALFTFSDETLPRGKLSSK